MPTSIMKKGYRPGMADIDPRYEQAYRDGESNAHADWAIALDEELPADVDQWSPTDVAAFVHECMTRINALIDYCKQRTPWDDLQALVVRAMAEGRTVDEMQAIWENEIDAPVRG